LNTIEILSEEEDGEEISYKIREEGHLKYDYNYESGKGNNDILHEPEGGNIYVFVTPSRTLTRKKS
jgi:hypothetical protein